MIRAESYLFSLTISLLLLAGCADRGPTGSWQQNLEARRLFESGTILENHRYYYTGSKVQPNAVIAISKEYTLESNLWVPIDVSASVMKEWLFMFRTDVSIRCPYLGGYITTPDRRAAGIWYSKEAVNTIYFPAPGIIQVYQPYSVPGSACDRERIIDDL